MSNVSDLFKGKARCQQRCRKAHRGSECQWVGASTLWLRSTFQASSICSVFEVVQGDRLCCDALSGPGKITA